MAGVQRKHRPGPNSICLSWTKVRGKSRQASKSQFEVGTSTTAHRGATQPGPSSILIRRGGHIDIKAGTRSFRKDEIRTMDHDIPGRGESEVATKPSHANADKYRMGLSNPNQTNPTRPKPIMLPPDMQCQQKKGEKAEEATETIKQSPLRAISMAVGSGGRLTICQSVNRKLKPRQCKCSGK